MSDDVLEDIKADLEQLYAHRGSMRAAQLFVALYEIVISDEEHFTNIYREPYEGEGKYSRSQNVFLEIKGAQPPRRKKREEESEKEIPIPDRFWEISGFSDPANQKSPDLEQTILGCLAYLDVLLADSEVTRRDPVASPITSKRFYVIQNKGYSPWGDCQYSRNKPDWISRNVFIPCQQKGRKPKHSIQLFRLNKRFYRHMENVVAEVLGDNEDKGASGPIVGLGVWPLTKDLRFGFRQSGPPATMGSRSYVPFRLQDNEENDWDALTTVFRNWVLPQCQKNKILILILPELSVPPVFLSKLTEVLKGRVKEHQAAERPLPPYPTLIVAGSFHVLERTELEHTVNQTVVLDYKGEVVPLSHWSGEESDQKWQMDKITRYFLPASLFNDEQITWEESEERRQVTYVREPEKQGETVPIVQTPLGRMTVVICRDYLAGTRIWKNLSPGKPWIDWIFVPTASPKSGAFEKVNEAWCKRGTCALIGNACWLVETGKKWKDTGIAMAAIPVCDSDTGQNVRFSRWTHIGSATTQGEEWPGTDTMPPTKILANQGENDFSACELECMKCLWTLGVELDFPEKLESKDD